MYICNKCGFVAEVLPATRLDGDCYRAGSYEYDYAHHGCGGIFEEAEECEICGKIVPQKAIAAHHVCTWCVDAAMQDEATAVETLRYILDRYPHSFYHYLRQDLLGDGELTEYAAEFIKVQSND